MVLQDVADSAGAVIERAAVLHRGLTVRPGLNTWQKFWIGLSLALSRNINRTFHEFHPLVVHDLHESASHLYVSTGRGPYNAWFDPIVINEWNNISYQEVREMTAFGVPGVYTFDVVVTDLNMPGMNGLEFCERIATNRSDTPVVVMLSSPNMTKPRWLTDEYAMSRLASFCT